MQDRRPLYVTSMTDANPAEEVKKRTFKVRDGEGFNILFDGRGYVKDSGKMMLCDSSIEIMRGVHKLAYIREIAMALRSGNLSIEPRNILDDDECLPIPDADIAMAILFHPENAPEIYRMVHRT